MVKLVRVLIISMLAAFTAGTVVHTTNASAMNIEMTLVTIDGAGLDVCEDCTDGGENMYQCDSVCLSPILAIVPFLQTGLPVVKTNPTSNIAYGVTGRAGSPEPYPPRSIILS